MSAHLTSTFTPLARCTTETWRMTNSDTKVGPYYALLGGGGYSSCMPSAFTPDPAFYYSPGLYCPVGYVTACSTTRAVGSDTTTIATCCPKGFQCQSTVRWPWESTLGCTSACQSSFAFTFTDASTLLPDSCALGGGFNAYSVQLRFQAADFVTTTSIASSTSLLASAPSPSLPTSAATTRSTPTSDAPANTGISAPSSDGGMSTSVKAGLGVGTVLGVALISVLCWLTWVLYSKSKRKQERPSYDQAELVEQPAESYKYNYTGPDVPSSRSPQDGYAYANASGVHEADGNYVPQFHELPATR